MINKHIYVFVQADRIARQTTDSRPNTAPAGSRGQGSTAVPSNGSSLPRASGSSSRSKPNTSGTSPSSTTVPSTTADGTASNRLKTSSIQMSALSNVLSTLGQNCAENAIASETSTADLNDLITPEVCCPILERIRRFHRSRLVEFNSIVKQ
jgi:hypothetical protein